MKHNRALRLISLILVVIFSINFFSLSVLAAGGTNEVNGSEFEDIYIPALVHTRYGGLVKKSLHLLKGEDALYISAGQMSDIGLMNGGATVKENSVEFVRDVRSIIDESKTLDTIKRTYVGPVVNRSGITYIDMYEAFELMEVNHYFDGETIVVFPRLYLDDEYSTVLDEIFRSNEFSIEAITDAELLGAGCYAFLKDWSLIGSITGSEWVDRYKYVISNMLMPDANIKTQSEGLKEAQGATEWAQLSLSYGEIAETVRADIFTGFGFLADRAESYDAKGAFMDYVGIGKGTWVSDVIDEGKDINSAIGYALTYQNAQQVADFYTDALYYGVVKPGGNNTTDVYTSDSHYLTRAADYIYNEMDGNVPGMLSENVCEDFLKLSSNELNSQLMGEITDFEFNALRKAVLDLLQYIGADQEIEKGLNTVICDNICERSRDSYYANRNVDNRAMKYCAIMHMLSAKYYCDLYDDYPTMLAQIKGWQQSDSLYFRSQKLKAEEVITRLIAVDDVDAYVASRFSYQYCYSENDDDDMPDYVYISSYRGNSRTVTVPESIASIPVTEIGENAFKDNKYLRTVNLPDSIESIGDCAFESCSSLENINLPQSLTYLGKWAFNKCSSLRQIDIPEGVKTVKEGAFSCCSSLISVYISDGVESLEGNAFSGCESLVEVTIPGSLADLGKGRNFTYCESLKEITIPNVKEIFGEFDNCTSLEYVNIPSAETIYYHSFANCPKLRSINMPNVTSISSFSFVNCGIEVVDAPKLKTIGWRAFDECTNLKKAYLSSVETIGLLAFNCYSEDNPYLELYFSDNNPQFEKELVFGQVHGFGEDYWNTVNHASTDGLVVVYVPCTRYDDFCYGDWYFVGNAVIRPYHELLFGVCSVCGEHDGVRIDRRSFADPALREYLSEYKDVDHNNVLDDSEISKIKTLDCWEVEDYSGIEVLSNLEELNIYYADPDSIDFTKLTELKQVTVFGEGKIDINNCNYLSLAYSQGVKYYTSYGVSYYYIDNDKKAEYRLSISDNVEIVCDSNETSLVTTTIPVDPSYSAIIEGTVYSGSVDEIISGDIKYCFTPKKDGYYLLISDSGCSLEFTDAGRQRLTDLGYLYWLEGGKLYRLYSYESFTANGENNNKDTYNFSLIHYDFEEARYSTEASAYVKSICVDYGDEIDLSVVTSCDVSADVSCRWYFTYSIDDAVSFDTQGTNLKIKSDKLFDLPSDPENWDYSYFYLVKCEVSFVYKGKTIKRWVDLSVTIYPVEDTTIGWVKDNDTWYYYDYDGTMTTGWKMIDGGWYYFDPEGRMLTGSLTINGSVYYLTDSGKMFVGWKQVDSKWYYFDPSSGAQTQGWKFIGGEWYYFNLKNYAMETGWQRIGGRWYYFHSSGAMLTGWQKISGTWYYFNSSGAMLNDWQKIGGKWYYFEMSGAMVTGWREIGGAYYYLKSDGSMAANEYCNGYWLDSNGKWTKKARASWKQDSTGWYYQDTTGWYAKSTTLMIDGVNYRFNEKGYWIETGSAGGGVRTYLATEITGI